MLPGDIALFQRLLLSPPSSSLIPAGVPGGAANIIYTNIRTAHKYVESCSKSLNKTTYGKLCEALNTWPQSLNKNVTREVMLGVKKVSAVSERYFTEEVMRDAVKRLVPLPGALEEPPTTRQEAEESMVTSSTGELAELVMMPQMYWSTSRPSNTAVLL